MTTGNKDRVKKLEPGFSLENISEGDFVLHNTGANLGRVMKITKDTIVAVDLNAVVGGAREYVWKKVDYAPGVGFFHPQARPEESTRHIDESSEEFGDIVDLLFNSYKDLSDPLCSLDQPFLIRSLDE